MANPQRVRATTGLPSANPDRLRSANPDRLRTGSGTAGGGFNAMAAGNKTYGGGRSMPNIGRSDPTGYARRDAKADLQRNALLGKLKAKQSGNFASAKAQRPIPKFGRM